MKNFKKTATALLLKHYFIRLEPEGIHLLQCPIDVVKLACAMGVKVYARGGEEDWYPYSGGCCKKEGETEVWIEFNKEEPKIRQRQVIAYALGMRMAQKTGWIGKDDALGQDPDILEFAQELVLPERLVRYALNEGIFGSKERLALHFGVDSETLSRRLIGLRLV